MAGLGQAQDRQEEILPTRTIDPRCAKNIETSSHSLDRSFARKFTFPINIQWIWLGFLGIWFALGAIEDVIRRVMNERRADFFSLFCHDLGSVGVDLHYLLRLRFCSI